MRRVLFGPLVVSIFIAFGLPPSAGAQTARDPAAVATVQAAIVAMGGAAYYSQTNGVVAHGTLTAGTGGVSGGILWENAGDEFRYERPGPNGRIIFVSGHGKPAIVDNGKVQRHIGHVAMVSFALHLPAVVLASELNNAHVDVDGLQDATINDRAAIKVSTTDETDSLSATVCKQVWYFDPGTLLPFRVDYLATEARNALNTAKMTTLFSDYRSVSGALIPFRIITFFEAVQISDIVLDSVQLNASINPSDFDAPAGSAGGAQ